MTRILKYEPETLCRAGCHPEYWIVNLDDRQIEIYSQARGRGAKRAYPPAKILQGEAALQFVLDGNAVGTLSVRELLG